MSEKTLSNSSHFPCPNCRGRGLGTTHTRHVVGATVCRRECRGCGTKVVTEERVETKARRKKS